MVSLLRVRIAYLTRYGLCGKVWTVGCHPTFNFTVLAKRLPTRMRQHPLATCNHRLVAQQGQLIQLPEAAPQTSTDGAGRTSEGCAAGLACRYSAATPETIGQAIDVPEAVMLAVVE